METLLACIGVAILIDMLFNDGNGIKSIIRAIKDK